jgi:chemotaxis protein methyltransferase CheR
MTVIERASNAGAAADRAARERIRVLVREASGLEFPTSRRHSLDRAIDRALREARLPDAAALEARLAGPERRLELEAFVAGLTVGETHFFRHQPQLDALRHHVLPELIRIRLPERRLRIWSAGCATGEEAYSLAMIVDELLPRWAGWSVSILATDINRAALERAQRAVFGPWSFRGVPEHVKERYFRREGRQYHLSPRIREMVTFGYLNLVGDGYPSLVGGTQAMDLILCRNVLIYFSEATARRVVERLEGCLADGGWLVAGHAEAAMPVFRERFEPFERPRAVLHRKRWLTRRAPATLWGAAHQRRAPEPAPALALAPEGPTPEAHPVALDGHRRAEALWRTGDAEGALAILEGLAGARDDDARAPYLAAKIQASRLRLESAERTVELALRRDPMHAPAHHLHGLILDAAGRRDSALAALRRAVYLDPGFALGHYSLAAIFARAGQTARAGRELDSLDAALRGRDRGEEVAEGDGVSVGRLLDLAAVQRGLLSARTAA